jgi:superfamily I DNA and/or RNA helicase
MHPNGSAPAAAAPPVPARPARTIGVVTLLAAQREAVSDLLLERVGRMITVDTPETFQGDERDVLVVSLVVGADTRRELVELVGDDARLDVALAGARARLIVVGDLDVAASSGTRLAEVAAAVAGDAAR